MSEKKLTIAVISDLHCHPTVLKGQLNSTDTYLLTDKLRSKTHNHPVASLSELVSNSSGDICAELTLCLGDFTNKASVQGFISGWDFSLEIHQMLNSKEIIATIGNHDVDVYEGNSNYTLEIARGIRKGFPIIDETARDVFWSKGCVFVERDNYRILVINSSHFHHNKSAAVSGKVDAEMLEYIDVYMKGQAGTNKISLAMSHHHPIDHSVLELGEFDKIVNGDELLSLLGRYEFDLYLHGHKHHPLLRYHNTTESNFKLPIFSSGSFSSSTNLMHTSYRNFFHLIEITKGTISTGMLKTWTFFPGTGWDMSLDLKAGFAPYSGFGSSISYSDIYEKLVNLIGSNTNLMWDTVCTSIPEIQNLIPQESKSLYDKLVENGYTPDKHLWDKPTRIFNINVLQ